MRPHSQAAKTSPSHGEGVGSIPAGVTKRNKSELFRRSKLVRICFFTVCLARSAPRGALLADYSPLLQIILNRAEQIKRINDLQDYIAQQTTYLTEFDEALVQRWIKQITIWDDHITVELKSGVNIDVDA